MTTVLRAGTDVREARLAVVLVHGRGGSAADLLSLTSDLGADDAGFVAPEAPGHTWYPYSFLAPMTQNEPHLSTSLATIGAMVDDLLVQGLSSDRIALLGFSQGACLALEFAARNARRYAGLVAFSGGLIGPPGTPRTYPGSFVGTPVFLGCSDVDAHIPLARVHESAAVFERMGASVDARIYPGMGHTIVEDEVQAAAAILAAVSPRPRAAPDPRR
ncbi:MAG TPA: alpha/beta fold hydrolase [Vicinamibacterales bacterium]|jgi:predicted esterase